MRLLLAAALVACALARPDRIIRQAEVTSTVTPPPEEISEVTEEPIISAKLDKDGNGMVSLEEAEDCAFKRHGIKGDLVGDFFAKADKDHDGQLTVAEFLEYRKLIREMALDLAQKMLADADKDKDGKLNLHEAQEIHFPYKNATIELIKEAFTKNDKNEDGFIDDLELVDLRSCIRKKALGFDSDEKEADKKEEKEKKKEE